MNRDFTDEDFDALMHKIKLCGAEFMEMLDKRHPEASQESKFLRLMAVLSAFQMNGALGCVFVEMQMEFYLKGSEEAYKWAVDHVTKNADEINELTSYYAKHGKYKNDA